MSESLFYFFFLSQVEPTLAPLLERNVLSDPPSMLTSKTPSKKCKLLLEALNDDIRSRRELRNRWADDPTFLYSVLALWIRKDKAKQDIFQIAWKNTIACAARSKSN